MAIYVKLQNTYVMFTHSSEGCHLLINANEATSLFGGTIAGLQQGAPRHKHHLRLRNNVCRDSPQFEASQITLKPQITAAAAVILFCSWETSTHERLFNCILTLTVEVLDTIQRPTVAGMKLSEHVHEFLVLLSLSLLFFSVRWCLNGASVLSLAECYQPADRGRTATMAARSWPFKHENISFLPGFYRSIMSLRADNSVHNELKCFHSLSLQYNLIALLVIEPLC